MPAAGGEPAPESGPDPDTVDSPAELAAALNALRNARGLSYAALNQKALPDRLPSPTLSGLLTGKVIPKIETLEVFLRACGVPRPQWELWQAARKRALSPRAPALPGAVRVSRAVARDLGVHKAIEVDGADGPLPVYVERDIDTAPRGVQARLRQAMDGGGMVVLVGGSSVGKSRCAVEAVRALMGTWWLVHPKNAAQVRELADVVERCKQAGQPLPKTVVWLDELQTYFDGDRGLSMATAHALRDAGMVLMATLWPEYHDAYTTPPASGVDDRHRIERQVLERAETVHIDATLSKAERIRAEQAAAADPRIRIALQDRDYGMTQVLAAVPQLIDRWRNADAYAKAVLCAAADAVRLGVRTPLTADLLRMAAPGYCTLQQKAGPADWFETALAYATKPLHGAAAALAPVAVEMGRVDGYTLADYLRQHAAAERRMVKVPASTWEALVAHLTDPADSVRVAKSAEDRLLYCYAEPLYRAAADADDSGAARRLAGLLAQGGRVDELRERADAGDSYAALGLFELLKRIDPGEADRIRRFGLSLE